jgi:DNA repair protein RecO (recombination protein O)
MAIVEDQGLVLRSQRYRETSRIVTILTPAFGKISLIGKGAREQKSPFGAALEPLTQGHYVFYLKKERSLHLLKAASVEREFSHVLAWPAAYYLCSAALEFGLKILPDEDPAPELYGALDRFLTRWDCNPHAAGGEPSLKFFQLQAVSLLGYAPQLEHCTRCGGGARPWAGFGVAEGGILCPRCAGQGQSLPISPDTMSLLASLLCGEPPAQQRRRPEVDQEAVGIVAAFLRYHVPGYQGLRALRGWHQWQALVQERAGATD